MMWICKNQLGRRNLTDEQRTYLLGKLYEARKHTIGEHQGNQYSKAECGEKHRLPNGRTKRIADYIAEEQNASKRSCKFCNSVSPGNRNGKTINEIADEFSVSGRTVFDSYNFSKGIDAIKAEDPELAEIVYLCNILFSS